jgi:mRNA-degrading endonuclease RelE of RelBE toxin-antitoxin system
MNYNVIATPRFKRDIKKLSKKYQSLKKEYALLLDELEKDPQQGTSLGNNCYKIRISIASKGKGKSGGARVITHIVIKEEIVFLLTIYYKSEKENITDHELDELLNQLSD